MKKVIEFFIEFPGEKSIIFSSNISGLKIGRHEYRAKEDGMLIYDKVSDIKTNEVVCQLSTNTSTLIPALKVLNIPYNKYFDRRDVIESQNDITFYWNSSYLANFYNKYSTDGVDLGKREKIIQSAVSFLIDSKDKKINEILKKELLNGLNDGCKLLGFFEGFPIFDAAHGLPMLKSRVGVHVGIESVMVSTPMDRYAKDVIEVAEKLERKAKVKPSYKKNRVRFEKTKTLIKILKI